MIGQGLILTQQNQKRNSLLNAPVTDNKQYAIESDHQFFNQNQQLSSGRMHEKITLPNFKQSQLSDNSSLHKYDEVDNIQQQNKEIDPNELQFSLQQSKDN